MAELTLCGASIAMDVAPNCDNIITPGLEQVGVIINRNDIKGYDYSSDFPNVIEGINLKDGKKGHIIYQMGAQPFNGTAVAFEEGSIVNTFTNTCSFVILDNGPEVCADVIDQIANGEFVVLFKNKFSSITDGNHTGYWQVMGKERGLKANGIDCDKYSDDTNSGWQITLQETKATKSAWFIFKTSDDPTKTSDEVTEEIVQGLTNMTW